MRKIREKSVVYVNIMLTFVLVCLGSFTPLYAQTGSDLTAHLRSFDNAGVIHLPVATNLNQVYTDVDYPTYSRQYAEEGKLLIAVKVDECGDVVDYKVMASPSEHLTKACLEELDALEFEPAVGLEGKMTAWTIIPFTFQINF